MTEGYVHSTPSVADGVAYVSGCDEIFRAIRVKDGQELYQVPSIAYTGASPALAGDAAYFGTFSNQVVSVSRKAREVLWRYESKESQFPFYSSAAVVGGRVVLGGRDRKVHCLEAATGQPLWTFATRARVDSLPGRSRGPDLRGIQRRPLLRPEPHRRQEDLGVQCRGSPVRLAGGGRREDRHRVSGRPAFLLRLTGEGGLPLGRPP